MSLLLIGGCGYIGSALYPALAAKHEVHCVDRLWRGNPSDIPLIYGDYGQLTQPFLSRYDDIILLAAHSNVPIAKADPSGAFANNAVAFERLLGLINDDQRFIYASSSGIYGGFGAMPATEDLTATGNVYDLTKFINDALAGLSGKRCYGLRFGTVNGTSPNMRYDVMLNKMVVTALDEGEVRVQNPKARRPILGTNDLVRGVCAIVDGDGKPGIYNMASFSDTIAHLGAVTADIADVPLVLGESTDTYDFEIDSAKFENEYDFAFTETAGSVVRDLMEAERGRNR